MIERLIKIFERANKQFLTSDIDLLLSKVSERTLCGALMLHLHNELQNTEFSGYKVDVEYNRNKNGKVKTIVKTIHGPDDIVVKINCDLIVHSRGTIVNQDNLIAIEMKKSGRKIEDKNSDKLRLITLTKDSYDDIWSFDGKTLPMHVCRYGLGVYYEVNNSQQKIKLEYYQSGDKINEKEINY